MENSWTKVNVKASHPTVLCCGSAASGPPVTCFQKQPLWSESPSPSDLDLCIVREKDDKHCDGFGDDRKELATLASWAPADKRSTMSKLYYITVRWTWLEADTFNMQIHRIQVHPDTIHPGYMPMLHWWFVAITPSSTLAVGALGLGDQCDQLPAETFWLWEQKSMIWKTRRNR